MSSPGAPYAQERRRHCSLGQSRVGSSTALRQRFWFPLVDRPMLSRACFLLDPEMRALRVTWRTELLIGGYTRSANTYAVFVLQHSNRPEVRLAHPLHRPNVFHSAAEELLTRATATHDAINAHAQ